jgi:hypothetical protein
MFGSVKGLPIIKEFMEDYESTHFDETTCPIRQTAILEKHGLVRNGEYQKVADMTIFPEKMFAPKSYLTKRTIYMPYTRSIHHYDASWIKDSSKREHMAFMEKIMGM